VRPPPAAFNYPKEENAGVGRVLAAVAVALALAGCSWGSGETAQDDETVARVVDGDTLDLEGGDRVRLVQIDTPELREGECYGDEAARALAELLPPGTPVRLEADPGLDGVDRYGRLLRYVHRDGTNVNLELVLRGAASVWFFEGDRGRYADELLEAARSAQAAGRGLWGACPGTRLDPERAVETR